MTLGPQAPCLDVVLGYLTTEMLSEAVKNHSLVEILDLISVSTRWKHRLLPAYLQRLQDARVLERKGEAQAINLIFPGICPKTLDLLANEPLPFVVKQVNIHVCYIAYHPEAVAEILKRHTNLQKITVLYGLEDKNAFFNFHLALHAVFKCVPPSVEAMELRQHRSYSRRLWDSTHLYSHDRDFSLQQFKEGRPSISLPIHSLSLTSQLFTSLSFSCCMVLNPDILSNLVDLTVANICTQADMDTLLSRLPVVERLQLLVSGKGALSCILHDAPNLRSFRYVEVAKRTKVLATQALHLPSGVQRISIPAIFCDITLQDPSAVTHIALEPTANHEQSKVQCAITRALGTTLRAFSQCIGLSDVELDIHVSARSESHNNKPPQCAADYPFFPCPCWSDLRETNAEKPFTFARGINFFASRYFPDIYVSL